MKRGVSKGDLVVIYMPMVPQAMFTMLACARIGAPHSLIFGGFASKELSVRIDHAKVSSTSRDFTGEETLLMLSGYFVMMVFWFSNVLILL